MRPITHGSILLVGAKVSNFSVEITDNPRVIMWESDDKKWKDKDIPVNTQAIFFTKWAGHSEFARIVANARKKRITVFTPQGTGMIAKQVKELLGMNEVTTVTSPNHNHVIMTTPMTDTPAPVVKERIRGKLTELLPLINLAKTNTENARILLTKAEELGIKTTHQSLMQMVYIERKKVNGPIPVRPRVTKTKTKTLPKYENDAVVEIFDNILKELHDVREYLVQTTNENRQLRTRIEKFKNFLEND